MRRYRWLLALLLTALAGCAAGANYSPYAHDDGWIGRSASEGGGGGGAGM
jgi:hypothetical protein